MRKVRNSPESHRCTGGPGDADARSTQYTRGTCSDSTGNAPWVTPELRGTVLLCTAVNRAGDGPRAKVAP